MSTIHIEDDTTRAATTPASEAPLARHPTYQPIHKALRAFMAQVLVDLGRLDTRDADECRATLGQVLSLLALLASHLEHENCFIHPALEAVQRGSSARVDEDHGAHRATIEALTAEVQALIDTCSAVPVPARADSDALRLYRRYSLFMAENIEHMHHEETVLHAILCAGYSDAELHAIHARLLASVPPAEMMLVLGWMLPALTPAQRAAMLGEMRTQAPLELMRAVLNLAQDKLDMPAWAQLAQSLGLPPVPGLMTAR
jgi:iron-sulfur cluster repair protein YtfE (RIC family)